MDSEVVGSTYYATVVCHALCFDEAGAEPMQRLMHDVPGPQSNERRSAVASEFNVAENVMSRDQRL